MATHYWAPVRSLALNTATDSIRLTVDTATDKVSWQRYNGATWVELTIDSVGWESSIVYADGVTGGQTIVGGVDATDALSLQGTAGNGTANSAAIQMKVGNNGATTAWVLNNNGCIGHNVTPKPWVGLVGFQFGTAGAFYSSSNSMNTLMANGYWDDTQFRYINTGYHSRYTQNLGCHVFYTGASGTAGDAITYNEVMRIANNGYVGILTNSASYALHVNGTVAGTAEYVNLSDERLKKNVVSIKDALATVKQLDGVQFAWRSEQERVVGSDMKLSTNTTRYGFIAQDVEKVIPSAVQTSDGEDALKSMSTGTLIPFIVEAIKEIETRLALVEGALA